MRTFDTDLELAEITEKKVFEQILKPRGFIHTSIKWWFTKYGVKTTAELPEECDFIHRTDTTYGIEVKSLAGGYPTFCIEKWSDDAMKRSPGWIKSTETGLLKMVIIHNRADGFAYIYSPKSLLEKVRAYPNSLLRRAGNGCRDDSGWLVKLSWEDPEVGFITKVKLD